MRLPKTSWTRVNFERRGRELKKMSVEIARLLFTTFRVDIGLKALTEYRTKLDDVSDVFLQSFAFFLENSHQNQLGAAEERPPRLLELKSTANVKTPMNRHRR